MEPSRPLPPIEHIHRKRRLLAALRRLGGYRLDLKDGAGELARLGLHRRVDAHGRERAADDAAGKPEELLGVSRSVGLGVGGKGEGGGGGGGATYGLCPRDGLPARLGAHARKRAEGVVC